MTFDIYTTKTCPHCIKAKALLDSKGYKYREFVVGSGTIVRENIQDRVDKLGVRAQIRTVPQIFLMKNGLETYIGGSDDLSAKIDTL